MKVIVLFANVRVSFDRVFTPVDGSTSSRHKAMQFRVVMLYIVYTCLIVEKPPKNQEQDVVAEQHQDYEGEKPFSAANKKIAEQIGSNQPKHSPTSKADSASSNQEKKEELSTLTKSQEQSSAGGKPSCQPVKHFAMTKIEKPGSSTLFTIFARFVRENNLNILVQKNGWHVDWRTPGKGKGKEEVTTGCV